MTQHQCMAQRTKVEQRCSRKATKMVAPIRNPYRGTETSIDTVYLCGMCHRRLHSGVKVIQLMREDGTRHTVWVNGDKAYCCDQDGAEPIHEGSR